MKIQSLEEELEQSKEMFYSVRRDLERSKAEFDAYSDLRSQELETSREEFAIAVAGMKKELMDARDSNYIPDKDELIRSLKLKAREMEYIVDTLRQDVLNSHKERDEMILSKAQYTSNHEEETLRLRSQLADMNAETAVYEYKIASTSAECEKKEIAIRAYKNSSSESEEVIRNLTSDLTDKNAEILVLKYKISEDQKTYASALDVSKTENDLQVVELLNKLHDRDESMRRMQRETHEIQTRFESSDRTLKAEFSLKLKEIRTKSDSLELEVSEARLQLKAGEAKSLQIQSQQLKDLNFVKSEKTRIQREKDILHERVRVVENRLGEASEKLSKVEREGLNKLQNAEDSSFSQRERLASLQLALEKSTMQVNQSAAEVLSLNKQLDLSSTQLEALQREANNRYEALGNSYREKLQDVKQKFKRSLEKEKKRSSAYRDKAIAVHERAKSMSAGGSRGGVMSYTGESTTAELF